MKHSKWFYGETLGVAPAFEADWLMGIAGTEHPDGEG